MRTIRRLLNTIYVTQSEMFINKEGETLVFRKNAEKIAQIPVHGIEGIVLFNQAVITPHLIKLCSENSIAVSFVSYTGKFLVRIQNPISGNVRLRRKQYKIADNSDEKLNIACNFVVGKIYNCRCILQRLLRDHKEIPEKEMVEEVINRLTMSIKKAEICNSIEALLGIEGEAAMNYYKVFNSLLINKERGFSFGGRSRRPPLDETNALLSFFYTLLAHDCAAALETVGLDPQVGFYHKERPGRNSLALDLMEELRPILVDRFVVSLINNRQIAIQDFFERESGSIALKDESKRKILEIWQKRKQEIIIHPYLKEKIELGLIPYVQALLLARYVRQDIDGYPCFLLR